LRKSAKIGLVEVLTDDAARQSTLQGLLTISSIRDKIPGLSLFRTSYDPATPPFAPFHEYWQFLVGKGLFTV
jgi:hypothetical protein